MMRNRPRGNGLPILLMLLAMLMLIVVGVGLALNVLLPAPVESATDVAALITRARDHALRGDASGAIDAYHEALERDPDRIAGIVGLALVLDESAFADLRRRFAAMSDPAGSFETIAVNLLAQDADAALMALVEQLREIAPNDPNADYYEASILSRHGEHDEAADRLRRALPRAPEDERWAYVSAYLDAMIAIGRPMDGYRDVRGNANAFAYLANHFITEQKAELLHSLINAHRSVLPDDWRLPYYTGKHHAMRDEYDQAEASYRRGLQLTIDEDWIPIYREALLEAMYRGRRLEEALTDVEPADATAAELAQLCWIHEDATSLERVIEFRRADHPDDLALLRWEIWRHWLQDDYRNVVETVRALERENAELLQAGTTSPHAPGNDTDPYLVRALLRLGRLDEALVAARRSTERDGDPYFEVIVNAVAGDVAATERALERCVALGYAPGTFYDDVDAGRALSTAAFDGLRERFPPRPEPPR